MVDFGVIWHKGCLTHGIVLGSSCSTKHLLNIQYTQIPALHLGGVIDISSLDDHSIGRQIHTPSKCRSGQQNPNLPFLEHLLHHIPISPDHAGVVEAHTVLTNFPQIPVLDIGVILQDVGGGF